MGVSRRAVLDDIWLPLNEAAVDIIRDSDSIGPTDGLTRADTTPTSPDHAPGIPNPHYINALLADSNRHYIERKC